MVPSFFGGPKKGLFRTITYELPEMDLCADPLSFFQQLIFRLPVSGGGRKLLGPGVAIHLLFPYDAV